MSTTTPNYDIDYNDKRLTDVKEQEQTDIAQSNQNFDEMIGSVDSQYKGLQDAVQKNADTMAQAQQDNTDFAIKMIEQQKDKAQKDYTKEQSGAYVDWQKQSGQYGVQAEQMASQGMSGSGYSESSQVAMYNTYQNRVAIARESLDNVIMNYDNNIKEAILQNNSALAQIYSEASLRQQEIALEGFAYKNSLILEKANKEMELKQFYSNEYQNVLNQMNTENAMAENVRQFNEQQALEKQKLEQTITEFKEQIRQWEIEMERLKKLDKEEADRKQQEIYLAKRQMQLAEDEFNAKYGENGTETITARATAQAMNIDDSNLVKNSSYWNGERAENVGGYGYFSNGYQPKGVEIKGKAYELESTGVKFDKTNTTLWGTEETKQITVWTAGGKYFYWNGPSNSYVELSKKEAKSLGVKV